MIQKKAVHRDKLQLGYERQQCNSTDCYTTQRKGVQCNILQHSTTTDSPSRLSAIQHNIIYSTTLMRTNRALRHSSKDNRAAQYDFTQYMTSHNLPRHGITEVTSRQNTPHHNTLQHSKTAIPATARHTRAQHK